MTELEIVNEALTGLGSLPAESMADRNKNQARAIAAYYRVRDRMIRAAAWPSCITRALMSNMNDQACPWTADTLYYVGDHVTNDTLKIYTCTTQGISDSAGGPTGTSTGITDNTAVWAYSKASTALVNWSHISSTAYAVDALVTSDTGKVYVCITAGTTGAGTPPTGTGSSILDGTARWKYYGTPPHNRTIYAYQYIIPPNCLRVFKVPSLAATKETDQGVQYSVESKWLYSDQDDSFLQYSRQEKDPDRWDALLQDVVVLKIASDIALDVTSQPQLAVLAYQKWEKTYNDARAISLAESAEGPPEEARWEEIG